MVRILTLLLAFFALPANALVVGNQQYIIACSQQVPIPAGQTTASVINLACYTTAGNHYCTLRKPNGTSGYTVTAGKTLHIFAACGYNLSTGTYGYFNLAYGTSDVGMDSSSAPTSPVYAFGDSTISPWFAHVDAANAIPAVHFTDFQVPATSYYPFVKTITNSVQVMVYGYEI